MQCKYSKCDNDVVSVPGKVPSEYCSSSCKQAQYRSTRNNQPVTSQPVTSQPATDWADKWADRIRTPPSVDYDDADVHMSDICRRTRGKVTLPGDPCYRGVCVQDSSGEWHIRNKAIT